MSSPPKHPKTRCQDTQVASGTDLICEPDRRRPKRKREIVLESAFAVFVRRGFEGASIDEIAETAGVSRQTIYNNFASKEGLFTALVESLVVRMLDPLAEEIARGADVRGTLLRLAERSLAMTLHPSTLALHRLLVAEAPKFPHLSRQVYEAGAQRVARQLGGYLREQREAGILRIDDPEQATDQFFGMLIGGRQYRALMGVGEGMSDDEIRAAAEATVTTLLRAWSP